MTLIEWRTSADAVRVGSSKRRGWGRDGKETVHTYSALAVAFIDAEHGNVPPQITVAVG